MSLKRSKGNMYDWVTHTHSYLGGECPHRCSYCYVGSSRFGRPERYKGPIRILDSELKINHGRGKTIFIEHMGDLFADGVSDVIVGKVLEHCRAYPDNTYVFQSKNPGRILALLDLTEMPPEILIGTTIETNRSIPGTDPGAPSPEARYNAMTWLRRRGVRIFVTVEPVLDFDVMEFSGMIANLRPEFINIGADSKGTGLIEPSREKLERFIHFLNLNRITIRKKTNLGRLLGDHS